MSGLLLRGAGHCAPARVVTNDDLAARMDTSDAWIVSRTGIRRRHVCDGETQTQLAIEAARMALSRSGVRAEVSSTRWYFALGSTSFACCSDWSGLRSPRATLRWRRMSMGQVTCTRVSG